MHENTIHSCAEANALRDSYPKERKLISTNSRVKAAAAIDYWSFMHYLPFQHTAARRRLLMRVKFKNNSSIGFNTQPRGGGCTGTADNIADLLKFQHTAARRRLHHVKYTSVHPYLVSTHSRAEAAAIMPSSMIYACRFQHTAARRRLHSRFHLAKNFTMFQHTAARRRLQHIPRLYLFRRLFQHTAARRRLP